MSNLIYGSTGHGGTSGPGGYQITDWKDELKPMELVGVTINNNNYNHK